MTIIVYIDNDNLQFSKYESVLTDYFSNNNVFFKVFINEYELSRVDESLKNKYKFIVCNNNGKNSLDIAITIECMKDLIRNLTINTFVIVSNDSDFIPLCKEIKEYGKKCYLFVDRKQNEQVKNVYDKIVNMGDRKKKEHQLRELEILKEFQMKRKNENLQDQYINKDKHVQNKMIDCDLKIKIKKLLDDYFKLNTNIKKITYDEIQNLFNQNNIEYNIRFNKFLKKYLPDGYTRASGSSFVIKE